MFARISFAVALNAYVEGMNVEESREEEEAIGEAMKADEELEENV